MHFAYDRGETPSLHTPRAGQLYLLVEMDLHKLPEPAAVVVSDSLRVTEGFEQRVSCRGTVTAQHQPRQGFVCVTKKHVVVLQFLIYPCYRIWKVTIRVSNYFPRVILSSGEHNWGHNSY